MTLTAENRPVYMTREPVLTEAHLSRIIVDRGLSGDRVLLLKFNSEGTALLAQVTSSIIGKRLVFVIDGRPVIAPVIQSKITAGEAVLEGSFTEQEAERLARALSGS